MADITFDCPECSHHLVVEAQAAGLVVPCPECGTQVRVPVSDDAAELNDATAEPEAAQVAEPAVPAPEIGVACVMPEYRVVSMSEGDGADERITADVVAFKLNELTQEGWQLRTATTIQTRNSKGKPKQELLLILERWL